jgi:predicted Zn-dependent protease with MMP-like domain
MAGQDYDDLQEEADAPGEDYHYAGEPEFDQETLRSNERRSRFFFAAMCFLIALLFLSVYLNHLTALNDTLLQLGIIVFAAVGIFLLLGGVSAVSKKLSASRNFHIQATPSSMKSGFFKSDQSETHFEGGEDNIEEAEDTQPSSLTPFETLVQEALASIPPEFRERMNNVYVQVEYEPDEELLRRVGTKEGYTLLGLYEGVPLTTYGRFHGSFPETITIFQRTIERYCHGDPDRIREQVLHTVLHEMAHHFGIDHDEMPIWIK